MSRKQQRDDFPSFTFEFFGGESQRLGDECRRMEPLAEKLSGDDLLDESLPELRGCVGSASPLTGLPGRGRGPSYHLVRRVWLAHLEGEPRAQLLLAWDDVDHLVTWNKLERLPSQSTSDRDKVCPLLPIRVSF